MIYYVFIKILLENFEGKSAKIELFKVLYRPNFATLGKRYGISTWGANQIMQRATRHLKRTLQNCSKFSKRSLKEQNLAVLAVANFAKRIIQTSLKKSEEMITVARALGYEVQETP